MRSYQALEACLIALIRENFHLHIRPLPNMLLNYQWNITLMTFFLWTPWYQSIENIYSMKKLLTELALESSPFEYIYNDQSQ